MPNSVNKNIYVRWVFGVDLGMKAESLGLGYSMIDIGERSRSFQASKLSPQKFFASDKISGPLIVLLACVAVPRIRYVRNARAARDCVIHRIR